MEIEIILKLIFCHLIGDYVLQGNFIAESKGKNWYHMLVHCVLYVLPFYLLFGYNLYMLEVLFISHFFIDTVKARYEMITYAFDQFAHYTILAIIYYMII